MLGEFFYALHHLVLPAVQRVDTTWLLLGCYYGGGELHPVFSAMPVP